MSDDSTNLEECLTGLDPEVLQMLREDLPGQRDEALLAIERADWQAARDIVHAIHGSASFCRLHELQAIAAALEGQLENGFIKEDAKSAFVYAVNKMLSALS